jgi:hypothetical protein
VILPNCYQVIVSVRGARCCQGQGNLTMLVVGAVAAHVGQCLYCIYLVAVLGYLGTWVLGYCIYLGEPLGLLGPTCRNPLGLRLPSTHSLGWPLPPSLGWQFSLSLSPWAQDCDHDQPQPPTFATKRQLLNHCHEPLLFEVAACLQPAACFAPCLLPV